MRREKDIDVGPMYGAEAALAKMAGEFENVGVKFEWLSAQSLKDTPFGKPLDISSDWSRGPYMESPIVIATLSGTPHPPSRNLLFALASARSWNKV